MEQRTITLREIKFSAFDLGVKLVPIGKGKAPWLLDWPNKASCEENQLKRWELSPRTRAFGMPCGPINDVFVLDKDFSKGKKGEVIGEAKLGPIRREWLEAARVMRATASGGVHYFFAWDDRLKEFENKRIPQTTIDIRTAGGQVILYGELPDESIWKARGRVPDELFEVIKKLCNEGGKAEKWEVGNRNNQLNKEAFKALKNEQSPAAPVLKALKSGLPPQEIAKTIESAQRGAAKDYIKRKLPKPAKEPKISLQTAKIPCERAEPIGPLEFPTGSITIFAGMPGEGKTSSVIAAAAKSGKPAFVFSKETSMGNLIQPWWEQFGGKQGKLVYPEHKDFPGKPELCPWRLVKPVFIDAISSGKFGIVLIDLIYLLVSDELKNKLWETALLEIQNALHKNTAFVGTAHLKKAITDQPLLHHVRGATDLVGIPNRIMYIRRGKAAKRRVIIKLKDRATGDLDGGYLTTLETPQANMLIESVKGEPGAILKEHAADLAHEKDDEREWDDELVEIIGRHTRQWGVGSWEVEKYTDWAKAVLDIGEKRARRLLKRAGFRTKPREGGGKWYIYW